VRTATDCRTLWQPSLQFGRDQFDPHLLPSGFTFSRTGEYRLPGAEISENCRITIRGDFLGVVIRRRGVVYVYRGDRLWHRFQLGALAIQVLEVES